jgi:hypothetical protein
MKWPPNYASRSRFLTGPAAEGPDRTTDSSGRENMKLDTLYLGLRVRTPLVASAAPENADLDHLYLLKTFARAHHR